MFIMIKHIGNLPSKILYIGTLDGVAYIGVESGMISPSACEQLIDAVIGLIAIIFKAGLGTWASASSSL